MKPSKLKAIRAEGKLSMPDMADFMGIEKSTYQRYEDGSAGIPVVVVTKAIGFRRSNREFIAGMDARIVENLKGGMCPNDLRR